MGNIDTAGAIQVAHDAENREKTKDELRVERAQREKPPLSQILNLHDMEEVARNTLSYKALAYYSSASDEEISALSHSLIDTRI